MFILVQNDRQCPPGSCTEHLTTSGHGCQLVRSYLGEPFPDPARAKGVIVLGGEMGVHDSHRYPHLARVRDFMTTVLESGIPLLGICLGGQLLAQVAGGEVNSPSPHGELGVCRVQLNEAGLADPLFLGVTETFVTFQLHNDSFTVPPNAALLAGSPACPAQAFRVGEGVVYGVQFHPEVDREIVSAWGALSDPHRDLLTPFQKAEASFRAASSTILANFISIASTSRRP